MLGSAPRSNRALQLSNLFFSTAQWRGTLPWSSQLFNPGRTDRHASKQMVLGRAKHRVVPNSDLGLSELDFSEWSMPTLWIYNSGDELDQGDAAPRGSVMKGSGSIFIPLCEDLWVLLHQVLQERQVTFVGQLNSKWVKEQRYEKLLMSKVLKVMRGYCGVTQTLHILSIFEEKEKWQLERKVSPKFS